MDLKPSERIQRILISTTSRFIAEYEMEGLVITHAWPDLAGHGTAHRLHEGPMSRSAFMLSFVVDEVPRQPGTVIPTYAGVGEHVCSLLSLLFGKRFDSHGPVQTHGIFTLPNLAQFGTFCMPELAQNNHSPRSDIAVPLDLREIARIAPLLPVGAEDPAAATAIRAAARFYHQALQNAESEPEIAYLHLITASEVLANAHHPRNDDLLEEEIKAILESVRQHVPEGKAAADKLAARMRQIKRRVRLTIEDLIDECFFQVSQAAPAWARLRTEDFAARIAAAYDLRSLHLHTGVPFGGSISPRGRAHWEVQLGRPVGVDKKLEKALAKAPTYVGLERVIRYCLLRFAQRHGLFMSADKPA